MDTKDLKAFYLNRQTKAGVDAISAFKNVVDDYGITYAIAWAEDSAVACHTAVFAEQALQGMENQRNGTLNADDYPDELSVLETQLGRMRDELMESSFGTSTSLFHNANDMARHTAMQRWYREMSGACRSIRKDGK